MINKENTDILSYEIQIDTNNVFEISNRKYILNFIKIIYSKNEVMIQLYKLLDYEKKTFIKYVILKIRTIKNNFKNIEYFNNIFFEEIEYNIFLKNNISTFKCNLLYYYINNDKYNNKYTMVFDYLGETLEKFNIYKLDLSKKILLIIELLEQCIELNKFSLYHNDIKPDNICIKNNNGNYSMSLIDFGILYTKESFEKSIYYNTTLTSGSPEYYKINNLIDNGIETFDKELFDKSQHYAVAGIIFGIFIDKQYEYFNKLYEIIKKNKNYIGFNFDNCSIGTRFLPYNDINIMNNIKNHIHNLIKEHEEYSFINYILMNMFQFDYKKRLSFEEIKLIFEKKLNRICGKTIQ